MKSLIDIKKRYKRETIQQRTLFITDCGNTISVNISHSPQLLGIRQYVMCLCKGIERADRQPEKF